MKKNIFVLLFMSFSLLVSAQVEYDALRLSQTEIAGTARYMGLGGAMGALGADASAVKDNPAGLGIYRSDEFTGTLNFSIRNVDPVEWKGNIVNQDFNTNLRIDNFSYVFVVPRPENSPLVNSNFSFSYQKLANYQKSFAMSGRNQNTSFTDYLAHISSPNPPIQGDISFDNPNMPWLTVLGYNGYLINEDGMSFIPELAPGELTDPVYYHSQTGYLSEFAFGWGGNFNNNLFLGLNLNIRDLYFRQFSVYGESFGGGGGFELENTLIENGVGMNVKAGMIYLPTNSLRVGLSLHSPSYVSVSKQTYADLYSDLIPKEEKNPVATPSAYGDYNLWSPAQAQLSAAYFFGHKGFISGEYDFINYEGARFQKSGISNTQYYADINQNMKNVLNNVHVFKVGAEFRATPNLALRAGYANASPAVDSNYKYGKDLGFNTDTATDYFDQIFHTHYVSMGVGYRTPSWFIDFAFVNKSQKENFYPYQDLSMAPAELKHKTNNLVMSLGFRM